LSAGDVGTACQNAKKCLEGSGNINPDFRRDDYQNSKKPEGFDLNELMRRRGGVGF
jgi:hypothetical protein